VTATRTLVSPFALHSRRGRTIYWTVFAAVTVLFAVAFLFPVYWMITGAAKSSAEVVQTPPTWLPGHWHLGDYASAWSSYRLARHLANTFIQAGGAWLFQIVFDTAAAYALSRLRPAFGRIILGAMVATLMLPPAALLVPKYLTVISVPFVHANLLNNPLAIWLPSVANAFNLYLLKRFFDQLPREILEAAQIDGAGQLRILRSIVLPMSRPILAVVSIFAFTAAWQDFLWPLLVFSDTTKTPVSVALYQLQAQLPENQLLSAMVIVSLPTVAVFLIFQRHIIAGLGAGSIKG
jgi:multiple sugar transport system permease protein